MKQYPSSTSFRDPRSPDRFELNEFLENVTSFNRHGLVKPRVMLSRQGGGILPLDAFLIANTHESKMQGRVMNPNETMVLLSTNQDWKMHTKKERKELNLARWKCNLVLRAEGKDPKKWTSILKMQC